MTEISIGIESASYYLSSESRCIDDWARANNVSSEHCDRMKHNNLENYFISKDETVIDMAVAAIEKTLEASSTSKDDIDVLIFTHSARYSVPPGLQSVVSIVQSQCDLTNALAFTISQKNCVSILTSIEIARKMMIADSEISHVLIVCADEIKNTTEHMRVVDDYAVHSDGAAALLLSKNHPKNRIKAVSAVGDGKSYHGNISNPEQNPMFLLSNLSLISKVLREAKVKLDEVDIIVPDNFNLPGWKNLIRLMRVPLDMLFVDNFSRTGHVFCADTVINLIDSCKANEAKNVLVCINGVGSCYGAMLIQP